MPTGYTADIQSGKMTELREYALSCARAFGALVTMRDEPNDAPIPDRFEPRTSYHDKQIEEDRAALAEVHAMPLDEATRSAMREWEAARARDAERQARIGAERSRYLKMREQVQAWTVPHELTGLKKFMLDQINESIRFDCGGEDERNAFHATDVPIPMSGEEWKRKRLETLSRSIAYHTDQRAAEILRTEERNKWIAALRSSLSEPKS